MFETPALDFEVEKLSLFSTSCFLVNQNICWWTLVNLITEDEMQRKSYLYENRMFTNQIRSSIIWVGKERKESCKLKVKFT